MNFLQAAQHVLKKNEELYRRLASGVKGISVPKAICPCGYAHNLSPIPDDGWLTIRDRDHDSITPADGSQAGDYAAAWQKVTRMAGRLFECPECGRVMWSMPGDRCSTFKVFVPEKRLQAGLGQ